MKRIGEMTEIPCVSIADAAFPAPFASGLEYSAAARGGWTIVHVGMLMPEAHEIFVCAAGCLRGVVLSAAEINLTDRFSTVAIEEHNILDGDMEDLLIEGVTDILNRLPKLPKAVLIYSSCIHQFMGCDLAMCYDTLRARFPQVDFTDCYMNPTMRKSGMTPDQIMRRQLYSLLRPLPKSERHCLLAGNCFSQGQDSDLAQMLAQAGWTLHQISDCDSYESYQDMAKCSLCITTQAVAKIGGETLAARLGMQHLYLPFSFDADEIRAGLTHLAASIGTQYDGGEAEQQAAENALAEAARVIGDTEIYLDYMVTPRPLGLAKLLIQHGFHVSALFLDSFSGEEQSAFQWLQTNAPQLRVYPTVHAAMRRYPRGSQGRVLALGQKAAYFADTPYFVNLIEGGGLYGFRGIARLAAEMTAAFSAPKDTEHLISVKGLGCESCI